ncbi:hypothetical protein DFH08DRAFT_805749 [Mycena albidolilacea]|uniref:Uncharacterized protein n=1 Tax=Mycena albidolilacea TaxID=1033008 RepID=A0AAD7A9F8_9AGAR|nr:hypothetical protein DFH08DRAFT_805749 [Mycena albidolilacea]
MWMRGREENVPSRRRTKKRSTPSSLDVDETRRRGEVGKEETWTVAAGQTGNILSRVDVDGMMPRWERPHRWSEIRPALKLPRRHNDERRTVAQRCKRVVFAVTKDMDAGIDETIKRQQDIDADEGRRRCATAHRCGHGQDDEECAIAHGCGEAFAEGHDTVSEWMCEHEQCSIPALKTSKEWPELDTRLRLEICRTQKSVPETKSIYAL